MKNAIEKLRNMNIKELLSSALHFGETHTVTLLIVLAGVLVGLSSMSVRNLTNTANELVSELENEGQSSPATSASLGLKEETIATLLALKEDSDVSVSSNIASYRRSAFGDATEESQWVIDAANILEVSKKEKGTYPTSNSIAQLLRNQGLSPDDTSGRAVNTQESGYTYAAERCTDGKCEAFTLTAVVPGGIYQLGETDVTKRSWVNDTAEALNAYRQSSEGQLYPTEDSFIPTLNGYYEETFGSKFVSQDPAGQKVNDNKGTYSYRGVGCNNVGCSSFVLRTTFKDGALYFQQSQ